MAKTKSDETKIDLRKLNPEDRERVERVLNRRNYPFAIKTRAPFAEAWREAARKDGMGIGEWVEKHLNAAAKVS